MIGSKDKKISNVIKGLPRDYVQQIQTSENEAGQFVCQILINHNVPGAIEDLGEDVWKEIKDDWSAVTDFVESLPTLAPQVLQEIVQDAGDVVSVVEEIITNPAAALTGEQKHFPLASLPMFRRFDSYPLQKFMVLSLSSNRRGYRNSHLGHRKCRRGCSHIHRVSIWL